MKRYRSMLAATLALALLLLGGCKQTQAPQSRRAGTDTEQSAQTIAELAEAENKAVQEQASAAEPDTQSGEADAAADSALSHGELLERQNGDVIEIEENIFIAQTNDIYLNAQDYLGKTLVYEGIYKSSVLVGSDGEAELIHYVIRYGPGCCGFDDNAGFEVVFDGPWPQEDEWVEARGTLAEYDLDGWKFLAVELDSLTVKQERGAEYVAQ